MKIRGKFMGIYIKKKTRMQLFNTITRVTPFPLRSTIASIAMRHRV